MLNKIQKQCEEESPMITELIHNEWDIEIKHTKEPLWNETDQGYILAESIKNNPYNVTSVRITGKKTREIKLTDSLLETINEMIEDEYTPQFTR